MGKSADITSLSIGDVMVHESYSFCDGDDMCNAHFYIVTAITPSRKSVDVQMLGVAVKPLPLAYKKCAISPDLNTRLGSKERYRANGPDCLGHSQFNIMRKWDGIPCESNNPAHLAEAASGHQEKPKEDVKEMNSGRI